MIKEIICIQLTLLVSISGHPTVQLPDTLLEPPIAPLNNSPARKEVANKHHIESIKEVPNKFVNTHVDTGVVRNLESQPKKLEEDIMETAETGWKSMNRQPSYGCGKCGQRMMRRPMPKQIIIVKPIIVRPIMKPRMQKQRSCHKCGMGWGG